MPKKKKYTKVKYSARELGFSYKVSKAPSEYKDTTAYINAVYRKNKELIDIRIDKMWVERYGTPKLAFRKLVEEKMADINPSTKKNLTARRAIKRVNNSLQMLGDFGENLKGMDLMTAKLRYVHGMNFKTLLDKDKEAWRKLKQFSKLKGRSSYDPLKLQFEGWYTYDGQSCAVYSYDEDTYLIELQSPNIDTGASLVVMTKEAFKSNNKIVFEKKSRVEKRNNG